MLIRRIKNTISGEIFNFVGEEYIKDFKPPLFNGQEMPVLNNSVNATLRADTPITEPFRAFIYLDLISEPRALYFSHINDLKSGLFVDIRSR